MKMEDILPVSLLEAEMRSLIIKNMWYIIITEQRANVSSFNAKCMETAYQKLLFSTSSLVFSLLVYCFFKTEMEITHLLIYGPDVFLPQ